ncbi:MAG: CSLREA domain-containing protein [Anaerolineales bacterium]|nr:CSLREA domain-containing protein [Anaerolineales bacterium]
MSSQHTSRRTISTWNPGTLVRMGLAGSLLAGVALLAGPAWPAQATVITVTTTTDELNSDGDCSLREAIVAANTNAAIDACPAGTGADTITLPAGSFTLTLPGTSENLAATGDLDIYDDLTLVGASPTTTIIDAAGIDRVFEVYEDPVVHLSRIAITGGGSTGAGGAIRLAGTAALTLSVVRLYGTPAGVSTPLYAIAGTQLTILSSLIDSNLSGGIYLQSSTTAVIRNTTISGNTNDNGGAIQSSGTLTLVNSTISGNTAEFNGGGIFAGGTTDLYNVTVVSNTVGTSGTQGSGGGFYQSTGTVTLYNSIVANNVDLVPTTTNECIGTLTSGGHNLIEDVTGCTIVGDTANDIYGSDPDLDTLDLNGGGLPTHRLKIGSPAINAGDPGGCLDEASAVLLTDQRLFLRNGVCDLGAFEFNSPGAATVTPTLTNTPVPPTATFTHTPVPPTATRTNTPVPPTATRTSTPVPPTATRTNTPVPPTATRTNTPTAATATSTSTSVAATATTTPSVWVYLVNISKDDVGGTP